MLRFNLRSCNWGGVIVVFMALFFLFALDRGLWSTISMNVSIKNNKLRDMFCEHTKNYE